MSDHQNGYALAQLDADSIPIHLDRITYGDLKRLRRLQAEGSPELAEHFDTLLYRAVDDMDAVPLPLVAGLIARLTAAIQEAMQGKTEPAVPSIAD